jgi:hypothetical protein
MHERAETWSEANPEGRWRCYDYDEPLKRDKLSLDLFWIKDKSLTDTDSLPPPDILGCRDRRRPTGRAGAVHQGTLGPFPIQPDERTHEAAEPTLGRDPGPS